MPAERQDDVASHSFLTFVGFCFFIILSSQRNNMSIAVLCMVNWEAVKPTNICLASTNADLDSQVGEFLWSLPYQCQILGSYFYGLFLMQFPAELLVKSCEAKYIVLIGMLLSSICTLLTPMAAARWHIGGLILAQMFKAMGHALMLPAFSVIFGLSIPPKQLITYYSYVTSGVPIGVILTNILAGFTCNKPNCSWPFIFRFSGYIGIVWCLPWLYLCFYLFNSQFIFVMRASYRNRNMNFPNENLPIPYAKIFSSTPFWSYVAAGVASYWISAMNMFIMPIYFRNVFNTSTEMNGLLSSFPTALQGFFYQFSLLLITKRIANKKYRRRFFTCIGIFSFSVCTVLLTFVHCAYPLGILLMTMGIGLSGCNLASISFMPMDLSPNFMGILSGIMNTIGAIFGSLLPCLVGWYTEKEATIKGWERVFYASFFVTFVPMILFMSKSSFKVQPWNKPEEFK